MGKTRFLLSLVVVLAVAAVAQAEWINMNLSNGDFSTPGTLGSLGQSLSIASGNGTTDNGKLLAGWKALGGGYTNTASTVGSGSWDGSAYAKIVYGSGAGKTRSAFWVHDAIAGASIEATIYRLDYKMKIDTYDYRVEAMFLWGNTDTANPYSWYGTEYFTPTGTNVVAEYNWGQPPYGVWRDYTLFWDNTGGTTWVPDVVPGNSYGIIHTANWGAMNQRLGENLRVGFYSSKYSNGGTMNLDNVVVSKWGVVPEPSSIVLLGLGAVGLLGYVWRRRRQTA